MPIYLEILISVRQLYINWFSQFAKDKIEARYASGLQGTPENECII